MTRTHEAEMADTDLPELEADRREKEKEKERRGAGAAWSGASPGSGGTFAVGGQASGGAQGLAAAGRAAGSGPRVAGLARRIVERPFGDQIAFVREIVRLGPRGSLPLLKQAGIRLAVTFAAAFAVGEVVEWGAMRMLPEREQRVRTGAVFAGSGPASARPVGALPADGLFGALPGLFSRKKGFLTGGSPAPDASILKEGKPPAEAANGTGEAQKTAEGQGAPEGSGNSDPEAARWAEALAGATGKGARGFEKSPGLGGSSFSLGAMGGRGAPGGPGARGKGRPGGGAIGGSAYGGTLTAYKRGAPMRALVAGQRSSRLIPQQNSARSRLIGTTMIANDAARMSSNEGATVRSASAWEANPLGAQVVPDPIGLKGNPPGGGGGGANAPGGNVRPRPSPWDGGTPAPINPDGNIDITRPDLERVDDWAEWKSNWTRTVDIPPGQNRTLYIKLIEDARAAIQESRDSRNKGKSKISWGEWAVNAGTIMLAAAVFSPANALKAKKLIKAGIIAIGVGKALEVFAKDKAEEAEILSAEIETAWGQDENSAAIDYCISRARKGEGCEFRGDLTKAQQCGFKPQMTTPELQTFSHCMAEDGKGLQYPTAWYPEGNIDPNDRDKVCRVDYSDARLRNTGNKDRPYVCVRPPGAPPKS